MILFSATSVYHLLEFMVLKYKKYEHDKVTLFISEAIYRRYNNIYTLNNIFDKIIIFNNYVKFNSQTPVLLAPYFNNLFKQHNINLKDFKDIYIAGAQHSMGIYMLQIKHDFIFLEEASGEVSKPHFLENIEAKLQPGKEQFCKINGLYNANNPLIKGIICNFKTQDNNYIFTEKHIDFDVINELKQLKSEYTNNIISFFVKQTMITDDNKTILFTQQFANLKIHSYNNHCLIYQMFVDYFLNNDKIMIKKHPMDNMNYKSILSNIDVLQENFPSELIPLIYYNKNNKIATISSTSINSLQPYFNQTISLDNEYGMTDEFLNTHKYYLISFIVNTIFNNKVSIYINGFTNKLFKYFLQTKLSVTYTSEFENANIIILDDYIEKQINIKNLTSLSNAVIIFPCSKSKYIPLDNINIYSNNIIPFVITKKKIKENMYKFYSNTEDEIIYVYSNNKETINLLKRVKMDKTLQNTGIELETKILSEDEIRIKVLEGIINSLENKLEYVIKENKVLKEKLNIKE